MGVSVDESLVQRVAALAKLSLSSEEVQYYQGQLQSILKYVDQLGDAPLPMELNQNSSPSSSNFCSTPERQDEVQPSINLEPVLSEAPLVKGTSFQVPRIIE